jgi:hypothetical protein
VRKKEEKAELHKFIGIVNYFRNMWFCISELPLASFHWLASHQARSSLNGTHPINRPLIKLRKLLELKNIVLLCYPDFNKPVLFHYYTEASYYQLGSVIMQDKMIIDLYSQNLNTYQKRYTITERELSSAIDATEPERNTRVSC